MYIYPKSVSVYETDVIMEHAVKEYAGVTSGKGEGPGGAARLSDHNIITAEFLAQSLTLLD